MHMKRTKSKSPKTHSDILWHFTGGATWNKKTQCQSKRLKPTNQAFEAFIEILKSRTLRVGNYHEIIKCTVPIDKIYNKKSNKIDIVKNRSRTLSTSPVCCVADIQLSELFHHAKRYGKIAIGFKRSSLVKAGFNPVFYTLHDTKIILNLYNAQNTLQQSDCGIDDAINDIESSISELDCDHSYGDEYPDEPDEHYCTHDIDTSSLSYVADEVSNIMQEALGDLENSLAFIKTFDKSEFDTIYSEREWRSVSSYNFKMSDISALILPAHMGYYKKFSENFLKKLNLPNSIKLYQWEDVEG